MAQPIYLFVSVKGGVGKTALATVAALGAARRGHPTALLDADFTGASIVDGFGLCAPELDGPEGLAWTGPAAPLLDRPETLRRRRAQPRRLPWLDELVFGAATDFDPARCAWRLPSEPSIWWFPSSPSPSDARRAVQGLFEATFVPRLQEVVRRIADALGPDGVVVVDLPPGLFGVAAAFASFDGELGERIAPILVSTDARNDLYRSVEEYVPLRNRFHRARWLLNRNTRSIELVRADLRAFLGDQWRALMIERTLREVGWSAELDSLYHQEEPRITADQAEALLRRLA